MNDLQIIIEGTSKIHDIDIPNIYGGFGADKKAITDKTIAELHNMRNADIRKRISDNINRFENGIDYVNLKGVCEIHTLEELGYLKTSITQAKNIYLLSERGYMKLIKIMDTQLAWDIYNEMLNDYFYYKEKEEYVFKAEAMDRVTNGFNYKEIERFIEDNPSGIAEFKIDEFTPWVPSGRYPKQLIRVTLETTDHELNKVLKDYENKTSAVKRKENIKMLLEDNSIPYREIPNNFVIFNKKYSNSSMTLYTEEEVVTIFLKILNNQKAQHIRENLLKQGLIDIIPINNVTLTEKEKELTAKCEELEDTISDLKDELRASRKATENLNNTIQNLEKEKQNAYEAGIEEGKKQAKKEKGKNLFNNIKKSVKKAKKWIENKLGGDEDPQVKIETEINEYGDIDSNRIKPKADIDTSKLGKPQPIYDEETKEEKLERFIQKTNNSDWMTLRLNINNLVERVGIIQNKPDKIWGEMHRMISQKFRNGKFIPSTTRYIKNKLNDSKVNSYKLEELKYLSIYCYEIILENEENKKNPAY